MLTITEASDHSREWDDYVANNDLATAFHQLGWKAVIKKSFGHTPFFLVARDEAKIRGILPLYLLESRIFGRSLISLPFLDRAGVLADDLEMANSLCQQAIKIARETRVDFLELRNDREIESGNFITRTHKVDFILPLDPDLDFVWRKRLSKSVKNKVRIAQKSNLQVYLGNSVQDMESFYKIYCINLRFLGTPVYPQKFFINMLKEFPEQVKILLVMNEGKVIGGKILFHFKDTLYFMAQASMREYANLHPNNLLYWTAIEYASKNDFKFCDMGRSNIDSGPYSFKKHWGAEIRPLYWQYYLGQGRKMPNLSPSNPKFSFAINLWKRLPLGLTELIGPLISRYLP